MTTHNLTANLTSNPAFVKAEDGFNHKKELAHAFLATCSYSPPIASTRRRQPSLVVSYLKFHQHPEHRIPTGVGTAFIPTYPQKNGLDMNQLVRIGDAQASPIPPPYYGQEYNPRFQKSLKPVFFIK